MLTSVNKKVVDMYVWDKLVSDTYGRPYKFQQQDGCQDRGVVSLSIPSQSMDDEMYESITEVVNGPEMGVTFKTWLERDPLKPLPDGSDFSLKLFWYRNFYPDLQTVANDLYEKGLVESGDYLIEIDW